MFSEIRKKLFQKTEFRLAAWYSAVFIIWSFALCLIISLLLFYSVRSKERQLISDKFESCRSEYQESGLPHLIKELSREKALTSKQGILVIIVSTEEKILYASLPDGWERYNPRSIIDEIAGSRNKWAIFRGKGWFDGETEADNSDRLEISRFDLSDDAVIYLGQSDQNIEELISEFIEQFILILVPIFIAGVSGGAFLTWRTLRPLKNLVTAVRRVETGEMDARVPKRGTNDELDQLAGQFNRMLERIETLIRGMKEALDNVAHDLKTPLTRMRASIEKTARKESSINELREALMDCAEESERIGNMLDTLMDISEAETGTMQLNMTTVSLSALLEDITDLYSYPAEEKAIQLTKSLPSALTVNADRNRLYQVIANIIDNAVKYTPPGGSVRLTAEEKPSFVEIRIEDTGPGIPDDDKSKIFDRLYRGDKSRSQKGLGLGLSLVKAVISAHNGMISVENGPEKGAVFIITLSGLSYENKKG